jgi:hypothetical protein
MQCAVRAAGGVIGRECVALTMLISVTVRIESVMTSMGPSYVSGFPLGGGHSQQHIKTARFFLFTMTQLQNAD